MLLWFIPIQAFIQVLLPDQRLFVFIGMAELLIALACSYLLLAYRMPLRRFSTVMTDVSFPAEGTPPPALPGPGWAPRLGNDR
ncbi:MAG: hypothetical protein R2867_45955 [Caldilineaceae bacterium]